MAPLFFIFSIFTLSLSSPLCSSPLAPLPSLLPHISLSPCRPDCPGTLTELSRAHTLAAALLVLPLLSFASPPLLTLTMSDDARVHLRADKSHVQAYLEYLRVSQRSHSDHT